MLIGDGDFHKGNVVEHVRDDAFLVRLLTSIRLTGDSLHHLELLQERAH